MHFSIPTMLLIGGLFFIFISKVKISGNYLTRSITEKTSKSIYNVGLIFVILGLIFGIMHVYPKLLNENNSARTQENAMPQDEGGVLEVTQLEQINSSLQKGPVLVKIGAEWCGPCQAMKPILKDLATEYKGKVTITSVDVDQSPKLATYFEVGYIPDTFLVMGIENREYVYMRQDGNTTKDRLNARIVGQMEKEEYEKLIDVALNSKKCENST